MIVDDDFDFRSHPAADDPQLQASLPLRVAFSLVRISRKSPAESAFVAQLLAGVSKVPGIRRVRYATSHPRDFGREIVENHGGKVVLAPDFDDPKTNRQIARNFLSSPR